MLQIQEITDKMIWNDFASSYQPNTFLQSWQWGEFLKTENHQPFRLGLYEGSQLVGTALFTKITSKRATYFDCHGAPMIDWSKPEQFQAFHEYLIKLCKKEDAHFFRFRAPLLHKDSFITEKKKQGYVLAPMYFQAEHTMLLDLTQDEEQIMANMRKNTRYSVRKAAKEGVTVRVSQDPKDLKILFELYEKTVDRHGFVPYPYQFFVDEFEKFNEDGLVDLFFAEYNGQALSAAMIVYFGDGAYYHHGASIRNSPDVFNSYLVQWEAIKRAKERGVKRYDFFGVAPTDDEDHPRAGLTTFKRGFGGERVRWMHTLDYPINKLRYWPMYLFVTLERKKRGL